MSNDTELKKGDKILIIGNPQPQSWIDWLFKRPLVKKDEVFIVTAMSDEDRKD